MVIVHIIQSLLMFFTQVIKKVPFLGRNIPTQWIIAIRLSHHTEQGGMLCQLLSANYKICREFDIAEV